MTSFAVKTLRPDENSNGIVIASQQCFCVPHPAVHRPQHADFVIINIIYALFSFSSMNGDDEGDGPDWGCREFRDTLVETFPLLSSDDAVNAQLVCKAWMQASHGTAYPIVKVRNRQQPTKIQYCVHQCTHHYPLRPHVAWAVCVAC